MIMDIRWHHNEPPRSPENIETNTVPKLRENIWHFTFCFTRDAIYGHVIPISFSMIPYDLLHFSYLQEEFIVYFLFVKDAIMI